MTTDFKTKVAICNVQENIVNVSNKTQGGLIFRGAYSRRFMVVEELQ